MSELLVDQARAALFLSMAVALPIIAVAAVVGLFVAAFQAASQLQDSTLAHLPRMLAVAVALAVLGPWMGREIASFARATFLMASMHH
ncbi:MAG: hypothetical protein HOO96_11865 [Polyangiaceae bacterium]|nr:hypothetical protein [Polyangiaceae bacterium]